MTKKRESGRTSASMLHPKPSYHRNFDPNEKAKLIVVVDTEEEFDWTRSFSRKSNTVNAMRHINRMQAIFDEYCIIPVYVVDYPVASQLKGFKPLQEIYADGRCLIGAHLHPWVTPPFDEVVNVPNSFPGNLPRPLEAAKLQVIGGCIETQFGFRPTIYKAGRYGVGPHTAAILEEQGYEIDLSVCPHMDYSGEGGPDYTRNVPWPIWFGTQRRLLAIPLTVGFTGLLRCWGTTVEKIAARLGLSAVRLVGRMSRFRLLDKIWLSPEGYRVSEQVTLARMLHHQGLRVFSFAFHSPSLDPGNTPYVTSAADLERFISRCRRFFDFFMDELGGHPSTPLALKKTLAETHNTDRSEDL